MRSLLESAAAQRNRRAVARFERAVADARVAGSGPLYEAALDRAVKAYAWLTIVDVAATCARAEAEPAVRL